jgi:hypothetical protein
LLSDFTSVFLGPRQALGFVDVSMDTASLLGRASLSIALVAQTLAIPHLYKLPEIDSLALTQLGA